LKSGSKTPQARIDQLIEVRPTTNLHSNTDQEKQNLKSKEAVEIQKVGS
jgi:hypothetical protein